MLMDWLIQANLMALDMFTDPLDIDLTGVEIGGFEVAAASSKKGISRRYPMPMPTLLNPSIISIIAFVI